MTTKTEPADALAATLDGCYGSPGLRGQCTENPQPGCELDAERPRSRRCHDICIDYAAQSTSTTPLLHPLHRCRSLHRTASKMRPSPLPLLALAALGAAFVLPPRQHLAVRIRADEIEAAEDAADAEPRTAPEVNSGAEAVELRA